MCALAETLDTSVDIASNGKKFCGSGACSTACNRLAAQRALQVERAEPARQLPIDISEAFLGDILTPYKAHAKYLKSAQITYFRDKTAPVCGGKDAGLVTGEGRFSIPSSCYIDDTGHFNAVEFNICYNQLAYVLFGKCLEANILQNLRLEGANVSFADFKQHQLPAMLIVSIESRYYKMLKSDDFRGEMTINRISASAGAYFCFTSIVFSDDEGVKSKGTVLLAFNPPKA